ncbi:MAG: ABC transporter ATP-binding protein/permease [Clostridia bacterium]|nr:ABC transporter ATP-binding protein/permease [Clostridia bacterium]
MKEKVGFDLYGGELCRGELYTENNSIYAFADGRQVFCRSLDGADELIQRTDIGCGSLEMHFEGTDDSECVKICCFTMSCAEEIGEFCKTVNHYIRTGEMHAVSRKNFRVCPTCGRHYTKGMDVCLFCTKKTYIIKRAAQLAKPYLPTMFLSTLFILLSNLANAAIPVLNGKLLDGWLKPVEETGLRDTAIRSIIMLTLTMLACQIAGQIMSVFSQRAAIKAGTAFSHSMRITVYDKIQRLSLESMSRRTAGNLMNRVTKDTEKVKNFITDRGVYAFQQVIMLAVITVILCMTNVRLTLLVFVPVPFVFLFFFFFRRNMRIRYDRQWRCDSRSNSILHDIVKGIRVVKAFGNEKREIDKYSRASLKLAEVAASNEHLWALTFPYIGFLMGTGEFLVLFFGGRMVLKGEMTVGQLLQFSLFLQYIYGPLNWFSSLPRWFSEAVTSLIKIFEILDESTEEQQESTGKIPEFKEKLTFSGVRFGYKSYEPVLKDIDLTVRKGEMIGLVGHSGAGKSTLINLVMRLYDIDSGSISIDGQDIRSFSPYEYRKKIGAVFQETFLFAGTVYDNIAYALPGATRKQVIDAARTANAHEFIIKLPDGYNTVVGENGHNLSGGEKQRIAIARAILRDPEILILDEATSALDTETESKIQQALARLFEGRTTIAIAHRLSTLRNADRLVVLDNGKIAEVGSHRELLLKDGIYAGLVMAQRQTARLKK